MANYPIYHYHKAHITYYLTDQNSANILSLSLLAQQYHVTYDSFIDDAFYVFDEEGGYLHFGRSATTNLYHTQIQRNNNAVAYNVVTMEDTMKHFSPLEVTRASAVRKLQHMLLCPSDQDLKHAIDNNIIGHNNLKAKDVNIAKKLWGTSEPLLKGKTPKLKSKMD